MRIIFSSTPAFGHLLPFAASACRAGHEVAVLSHRYSGDSRGAMPVLGTVTLAGGKCLDVFGNDTGGNGTNVDVWDCQSYALDQHWTHNADGSLETLGRCLDIDGNSTAPGTKVELWDCNGAGGQKWVQQPNGSLLNPQSGLCLDDPSGNTTNGTQLRIWNCNGADAQKFSVNGGTPVVGPGR